MFVAATPGSEFVKEREGVNTNDPLAHLFFGPVCRLIKFIALQLVQSALQSCLVSFHNNGCWEISTVKRFILSQQGLPWSLCLVWGSMIVLSGMTLLSLFKLIPTTVVVLNLNYHYGQQIYYISHSGYKIPYFQRLKGWELHYCNLPLLFLSLCSLKPRKKNKAYVSLCLELLLVPCSIHAQRGAWEGGGMRVGYMDPSCNHNKLLDCCWWATEVFSTAPYSGFILTKLYWVHNFLSIQFSTYSL